MQQQSLENSAILLDQSYYSANSNPDSSEEHKSIDNITIATSTTTVTETTTGPSASANVGANAGVSVGVSASASAGVSAAGAGERISEDNMEIEEDSEDTVPMLFGKSNTQLLMTERVSVAVHDGRFHTDEVLGVSILKILYDLLHIKLDLYRTRDPNLLNKCDIVLDVGQIYDPARRRFDHHQKECNETFTPNSTIKLSSAGMTWKEYGHLLVQLLLIERNMAAAAAAAAALSDDEIQTIVDKCYTQSYYQVIQEVDAHDNGQSPIYEEYDRPEIYRFRKYLDLGQTIAKLNRTQDESSVEAKNKQFVIASQLMEGIFLIHVNSIIDEVITEVKELPALLEVYKKRNLEYLLDIPNGVTHDPKFINKVDVAEKLLYNIYYQEHSGNWVFGTMQKKGSQFVNRKNLLSMESLKALLTPEEMSQVVFVHKNLFCGSAKTREVARRVCELSYLADDVVPPAPNTDDEADDTSYSYSSSSGSSVLIPTLIGVSATAVILYAGYKLFTW
jgi:uncharacterized UPF0160 family protein